MVRRSSGACQPPAAACPVDRRMLNVVIIVHFIPESVLLPEPVLLRPGLSPAIHTLFRRPADRAPEWLLEEPPISVRACTRQEESPIPPNLGVAQQPRDREARLLDVTAGNVASRAVPPPARDPTQPSRRAPGRMCLCGPASSAIDIVATSVWAESGFRCPGEAETEGPTMRGEARARGAPLALSGVRVAAICWSGGVSLCVIVRSALGRHASKLASRKTKHGRISHVVDPPLVSPRFGTNLDTQSSESCTAASRLDRPIVVAGAGRAAPHAHAGRSSGCEHVAAATASLEPGPSDSNRESGEPDWEARLGPRWTGVETPHPRH